MPQYIVKAPLNHDQVDYPIGSMVEMTEKQADPLLGQALALPGDLDTRPAVAVEGEAERLDGMRTMLLAEQQALKAEQEQFAAERAEFEAAKQTSKK